MRAGRRGLGLGRPCTRRAQRAGDTDGGRGRRGTGRAGGAQARRREGRRRRAERGPGREAARNGVLQARPTSPARGREQWEAGRPVPPRSPAGRAAAVGRARPKDTRRGRRRTGLASAPRPGCRLQVRGPRRIVRPSDRAHCAAGGGGRAGAHLPSAAAALIGVLPEQLRPGPRDPGRDPQLRRAARPPCASCRDRATLARPGPPSTVGVGECPGHSEGWTAPLFSQPVRMSATLHSFRGGRGRPVLGPTADPGPRIPHRRWNRSQPMGGGGFPAGPGQPSSGHRVRSQPQGQCPHLADRAFAESLCGILGSAIFFLLLGWASLGGPEVRLALSPSPCLSGKFLRPRAGRQAEQGRRRVR